MSRTPTPGPTISMHAPRRRPSLVATFALTAALTGAVAGAGITGASRASAAEARQTINLTFDSKTSKLTGFPASVKGGLTDITLTGGAYGVNLTLARIAGTISDADLAKSIHDENAPPPSWATFVGGTGGGAKAGVTRHATVNLDKGNYAWVINSDQSELDGKNPFGRFTVTSAKSATPPSGGTAKITTKDYTFVLSGLKAGLNTIDYSNAGTEMHHIIMFKLRPGKKAADFVKMFQSQKFDDSVDESQFINNLPLLSPKNSQTAEIKLEKGAYAFVCFMPDKTGTPHIMKGMILDVTIP